MKIYISPLTILASQNGQEILKEKMKEKTNNIFINLMIFKIIKMKKELENRLNFPD